MTVIVSVLLRWTDQAPDRAPVHPTLLHSRETVRLVTVQTCGLISCARPWRLRCHDDKPLSSFVLIFTLVLKKLGPHVQAWNVDPPSARAPGGLGHACVPLALRLFLGTLFPTVVRNCLLFGLMICFADLIVIAEPKGEGGTGFSWKNLAQR